MANKFKSILSDESNNVTLENNLTLSSGTLSVTGNIGINGSAGTTYPLYVQSGQRYILGIKNTAADASYPWLVHDTSSSKSVFNIHFNGVGDKLSLNEDGVLNTSASGNVWGAANDGSGSGLDADTVDGIQGVSLLRSDSQDAYTPKRIDFGASSNWDSTPGFGNQTNLHVQGHNQFWFGAGNGTWFTGTANSKSSTSGLAGDATAAHDLLITTMQGTSTYDRGITFAVDSGGSGNSGWRLGKWHSSNSQASSKLTIDGGLHVRGGDMANFDYYADDYSTYYDSQGGGAYWPGDTGWIDPSITAGNALQIQAGNAATNTNNPALQFHQYGYGGIQMRYDGPNDYFHIESTGSNRYDWLRNKTDHGYIDIGPANSNWAHIYTDRPGFYFNKTTFQLSGNQVWHAGNDGSGSGLDADTVDGIQASSIIHGNNTSGTNELLITDWNNVDKSGFYSDDNASNSWTTGWTSIINHRLYDNDNNYHSQIGFGTYTAEMYFRGKHGASAGWSSWYEVWHSGVDGSGSGLDADTLDGYQASAFPRKAEDAAITGNYDFSGTGLKLSGHFYTRRYDANGNVYFHVGTGDNVANILNLRVYDASNAVKTLVLNGGTGAISWNGSTIWHAGNDGSLSGLDADTLDGLHLSNIDNAEGYKTWAVSASGAQTVRHHIARLYATPAHWDANWQNIELQITAEYFEATTLKFRLTGNYGSGEANMIKSRPGFFDSSQICFEPSQF